MADLKMDLKSNHSSLHHSWGSEWPWSDRFPSALGYSVWVRPGHFHLLQESEILTLYYQPAPRETTCGGGVVGSHPQSHGKKT